MKYLLLLMVCCTVFCAYADSGVERGYTLDGYGYVVKSAYGQCVHTAYYDANLNNGRADCGDKKVVASTPVAAPKENTNASEPSNNVIRSIDASAPVSLTTSPSTGQ